MTAIQADYEYDAASRNAARMRDCRIIGSSKSAVVGACRFPHELISA